MKPSETTSDFVRPKLQDYITNHSCPDELYEIGEKVYISEVANVEIESVVETGDDFVVKGVIRASVQTVFVRD